MHPTIFAFLAYLAIAGLVLTGWPNRATRRAVQQDRQGRIPAPWAALLLRHPELTKAVKAL